MRRESWDVVVAGAGVAGLFCALNLPEKTRTLVICKEDAATCDSMLAQGGMRTLANPADREALDRAAFDRFGYSYSRLR